MDEYHKVMEDTESFPQTGGEYPVDIEWDEEDREIAREHILVRVSPKGFSYNVWTIGQTVGAD